MPLYDVRCPRCGTVEERHTQQADAKLDCRNCGGETERLFTGSFRLKTGYPAWVDRIDERQKRQADRGETPSLPHPAEVRAS